MKKLISYLAIGLVAVPLSIVSHELGHFAAYLLFGAANVQLHSVSVSADKEMLTAVQIAIAAIIGPLISYLTLVLAFALTRKRYVAFWVILALAVPVGRIVNVIYIYFRALGYDPKPNFDEYNFSLSVGLDPIWLSMITTALVLIAFVVFLRKAWRHGGIRETFAVVLSLVVGLLAWNFGGAFILP